MSRPPDIPRERAGRRGPAVRLRLLGAMIALAAGATALVLAILLIRSALS